MLVRVGWPLVLSSSSPSTTSDLSAEPGGVSRKLRRTLVLGPFRVVDVLLVGSLLNVTLEELDLALGDDARDEKGMLARINSLVETRRGNKVGGAWGD